MRILRTVFVGLLLSTTAQAGVELTLAGGYRTGVATFPIEARTPLTIDCFTTPCILAEARAKDRDVDYSVILDVPIRSRWAVEALLTRQAGDLELRSLITDVLERESFKATTAQIGLLRDWGEGQVQPFAAVALGGTRFESSAMAYARPFFPGIAAVPASEDVISSSAGAGLRFDLARHIRLRLEGRAYWHDLPNRLGGSLWQREASLGLAYRW